MQFMQITETLSVAGQLDADGMQAAIDAGFRTIICNRPDEEEGAIAHAPLQQMAEAAGVAFFYHPVESAVQTEAQAAHMAKLLAAAEAPILAYCRSGARSGRLFEMSLAFGG